MEGFEPGRKCQVKNNHNVCKREREWKWGQETLQDAICPSRWYQLCSEDVWTIILNSGLSAKILRVELGRLRHTFSGILSFFSTESRFRAPRCNHRMFLMLRDSVPQEICPLTLSFCICFREKGCAILIELNVILLPLILSTWSWFSWWRPKRTTGRPPWSCGKATHHLTVLLLPLIVHMSQEDQCLSTTASSPTHATPLKAEPGSCGPSLYFTLLSFFFTFAYEYSPVKH